MPLLRPINRQVKQDCVRASVSQGNDSDHGVPRGQRERLPIEVARPHVRLRENEQGDGLMTGDEPELIRGDLHGYCRPPVVLVDRCQAESSGIFHVAILAAAGRLANR